MKPMEIKVGKRNSAQAGTTPVIFENSYRTHLCTPFIPGIPAILSTISGIDKTSIRLIVQNLRCKVEKLFISSKYIKEG